MVRGRSALIGPVLLLAGACAGSTDGPSGGSSSPPPTGATSSAPAGAASVRTDVPDVVVRDVATGADVNLRGLGLPERPTLYWFWAPH